MDDQDTASRNLTISFMRRATEAHEAAARALIEQARGFPYAGSFARFRVGDTLHLFKASGEMDVRIQAVGALPAYRKDFGAITSGSSSLAQQDTNLQMPDGEMGQFRFLVRDSFEVEFTHPSATVQQWRTKNTNFRVRNVTADPGGTPLEAEHMFAASEFWVFEQEDPRFDLYALNVPNVQGHIEFFGYRYAFAKIGHRGMFDLWVDSWPSR